MAANSPRSGGIAFILAGEDAMARRVVGVQFRFVRPHRVHRTPADSAAVWRGRLPRYRSMAVVWALVTMVWAATDGPTALVTVLSAAACVLTLAVCLKAVVLI